jgi:tellurite methyltransferase
MSRPERAVAAELRRQFGEVDIYLFDQFLKGRFDGRTSVLDAGCGGGRNIVHLLRCGLDVHGVDRDPEAVRETRRLAAELAPALPETNFVVAEVDALPHPDGRFDAVISSAVLHFADDERHFDAMLGEVWRVLAPGGLFFARLASSIGIEDRVRPVRGRRHLLPDGTERFLVDEPMLLAATARLGGRLLDPIKTTNVQNLRCMTTWCMAKER